MLFAANIAVEQDVIAAAIAIALIILYFSFFKENVRHPVWICRNPISLITGTRFSLILGTCS